MNGPAQAQWLQQQRFSPAMAKQYIVNESNLYEPGSTLLLGLAVVQTTGNTPRPMVLHGGPTAIFSSRCRPHTQHGLRIRWMRLELAQLGVHSQPVATAAQVRGRVSFGVDCDGWGSSDSQSFWTSAVCIFRTRDGKSISVLYYIYYVYIYIYAMS